MKHTIFSFLTVTLSCGAGPTSTQQPASAAPAARAHHGLQYDEARQRVILAGGSTPRDGGQSFENFNDLWSFDGTRWSAIPPSGEKLSGTTMAYDAVRNRLVSFGAFDGTTRGLMRELVGDQWQSIGTHPSLAVAEPGFVFDLRRGRFVTFGGAKAQGGAEGETWEYAAGAWTKFTSASPPARQGHVMVYDANRHRTVVFGGMGAATPGGQQPEPLGDLWEFDGDRWSMISAQGPSARLGAGATFDMRRGLTILFGGIGPAGFLGDTWSWDGTTWRKLADGGPDARGMGYLAYDTRRDRVVLFGGRKGWPNGDLADTWEWDGSAWRRVGS